MFKERVEAVLTNITYAIGGVWMISFGALVPGLSGIVLSAGSGYHHWVLDGERSRIYDFLGMYLQGISLICYMFGLPVLWNALITIVLSAIIAILVKSSRTFVAIIIGLVLLVFAIKTDLLSFGAILCFISIAWTFNYIGDHPLHEYHSEIHGPGWHNVSAFSIMLLVFLYNYPLMEIVTNLK